MNFRPTENIDQAETQQPLKPSERLQQHVVSWHANKNDSDLKAIIHIARQQNYWLTQKWADKFRGRFSRMDLMDIVVEPAIVEALTQGNYSFDGGASFYTYVRTGIRFALSHFFTKHTTKGRDFRKQISLNTPIFDDAGTEMIDCIASEVAQDEDGLAEAQISGLSVGAVQVAISICLGWRERESLVLHNSGHTYAEISQVVTNADTGDPITGSRAGQIVNRAKKKIARLVGELDITEMEGLITPRQVVFRYFFPELTYDGSEEMAKLEKAGVIFSDEAPYVSVAPENVEKFNIIMFTLEDGTHKTGYEILCERHADSICHLFSGDQIDPDKFDLSESSAIDFDKPKTLTDEQILILMRSRENIDEMHERFAVYVTEDGKWHVTAKKLPFLERWIKLPNGKEVSGHLALKAFGLPRTDEGRKALFEKVFGEDQTDYLISRATFNTLEILGRQRYLDELRSRVNIRRLKKLGVTIEDGKCHIDMVMKELQPAFLYVNGTERRLIAILADFGLPFRQEGLIELFKIVFPGMPVLLWRHTNGLTMEMPKEDEVYTELRSEHNLEAFKKFLKLRPCGRYTVNFYMRTAYGSIFNLDGKPAGIHSILNKLDLPISVESVVSVLKTVFGEEMILDKIPPEELIRQMGFVRNRKKLIAASRKNAEGKIRFVGDPEKVFKGVRFSIDGKKTGISAVLNIMDLPMRAGSVRQIYSAVFGEEFCQ